VAAVNELKLPVKVDLAHTAWKVEEEHTDNLDTVERNPTMKLIEKYEDNYISGYEDFNSSDGESKPKRKKPRKLSSKTKHYCEICDQSFSKGFALKKHNLRKHSDFGLKCDHCEHRVKDQWSLNRHIATKHQGPKNKCTKCDFESVHRAAVLQHIVDAHGGFQCDQCNYQGSSKKCLSRHKSDHHTNKHFHQCQQCEYAAPRSSNLKRHILEVHESFKLKCAECDFSTGRKGYLLDHMEMKHGYVDPEALKPTAQALTCDLCSFSSMRVGILNQHKRSLHGIGLKHACTECEFSTDRRITLRKHMKNKHGVKDEELENASKERFQCDECGNSFSSVYSLQRHKECSHEEKECICDICAEVFKNPRYLKQHIKFHSENIAYTCNICQKDYRRLNDLKSHLTIDHGLVYTEEDLAACYSERKKQEQQKKLMKKYAKGENTEPVAKKPEPKIKYKCEVCEDSLYTTKKAFTLHVAKHYPPAFPCTHCQLTFFIQNNLQRHMRNMHVDDAKKKFQCSLCTKGFQNKVIFEGHMNMHRNLKPFICEICGKGFQNRSNKTAHMKKTCKQV